MKRNIQLKKLKETVKSIHNYKKQLCFNYDHFTVIREHKHIFEKYTEHNFGLIKYINIIP